MILFGLKTHFKKIFLDYLCFPTLPMQKNQDKMVPKQVFTGPPFNLMLIPEASTCRVKWYVTYFGQSINSQVIFCFFNPIPHGLLRCLIEVENSRVLQKWHPIISEIGLWLTKQSSLKSKENQNEIQIPISSGNFLKRRVSPSRNAWLIHWFIQNKM